MVSTTQTKTSREGVTPAGVFLSVPDAFPDALPSDIRSMVKLLFEMAPNSEASVANGVTPTVMYATDVAMLDFGALDPTSFDAERAVRDCEILAQVIKSNGESIPKLVSALQQGDDDGVDKAEKIANSIGLTEEAFVKQGGGLLFLVVVGAALLAGGCATTKYAERGRANGSTTTPKPPR